MRIVFFGTPDFAVPSLRALTGEGFEVAAVVTQPDRPRNRSRSTIVPPPVKVAAEAENLPVLQPLNPNTDEFMEQLSEFSPEIGVVVAYGHILKRELLRLPPMGMLNVHASLLPHLRGAAPIQHAIMRGDSETGITIMQMDEGMDTGDIVHRVAAPIAEDETGGELTAKLSEVGALALVEGLALLASDTASPIAQDGSAATYAPKLDRDSARIDWTQPAETIACKVRALDPVPGAWTTWGGKSVKLFGATAVTAPADASPGTIVGRSPFRVAAQSGWVAIEFAQPEGKKRMTTTDWCCGSGPNPGDRLS